MSTDLIKVERIKASERSSERRHELAMSLLNNRMLALIVGFVGLEALQNIVIEKTPAGWRWSFPDFGYHPEEVRYLINPTAANVARVGLVMWASNTTVSDVVSGVGKLPAILSDFAGIFAKKV